MELLPVTALLAVLALVACADTSTPSSVAEHRVLWRLPLSSEEYHSWFGQPAVEGTRAYWKVSSGVLAVDLAQGRRLWSSQLPIRSLNAPNILARHGMVAVADWWGVAVLDAATGDVRWTRVDTTLRHDTFLDAGPDLLYFAETRDADTPGPYSARLIAADLATGSVRWSAMLYESQQYTIIPQGVRVANDMVYAVGSRSLSTSGHLKAAYVVALRASDGSEVWRTETPGDLHGSSINATVHEDLLLLSDHLQGAYLARRLSNGQQVWRIDGIPGWIGPTYAPIVADGIAYAASGDRTAQAFDPRTGVVRWTAPLPASARHFALCGPWLLVESQTVTMIDRATGRPLGSFLGGESDAIPGSGFATWNDVAAISTDSEIIGFSCAAAHGK